MLNEGKIQEVNKGILTIINVKLFQLHLVIVDRIINGNSRSKTIKGRML